MKSVITKGDLSSLTPEQLFNHYRSICDSLKLNWLTKPFDLIETTDKETQKKKLSLYPNANCAAQLAAEKEISIVRIEEEMMGDYLRIRLYGQDSKGRTGINVSAMFTKNKSGKDWENAYKKAYTQAQRRLWLSMAGLGITESSDVEELPNARKLELEPETGNGSNGDAYNDWKCGAELARKLVDLSVHLKAKGATPEDLRAKLPRGIETVKDLTETQAEYVIDNFKIWLANLETVNGEVVNG